MAVLLQPISALQPMGAVGSTIVASAAAAVKTAAAFGQCIVNLCVKSAAGGRQAYVWHHFDISHGGEQAVLKSADCSQARGIHWAFGCMGH
jgi:hypothetical protein